MLLFTAIRMRGSWTTSDYPACHQALLAHRPVPEERVDQEDPAEAAVQPLELLALEVVGMVEGQRLVLLVVLQHQWLQRSQCWERCGD